ncbi:MAG: hypothetical protein WCT36_00040 [Candidatus Gracilibacteria bacterium]|jgi:hypothetical protein
MKVEHRDSGETEANIEPTRAEAVQPNSTGTSGLRRGLLKVLVGAGLLAVAPSCAGMFTLSREDLEKQRSEEKAAADHMIQVLGTECRDGFMPIRVNLNGDQNPHAIALVVYERNPENSPDGEWNWTLKTSFAFVRFEYTSAGVMYSLEVNGDYSGKQYRTRSESGAVQYVYELVRQYYKNQPRFD